eukprot:TRINITY_DN3328_c0_g1_i3.p1 TRINITY_DN3328_c0_g1~~TRINITY_DN3328_c0_g1_i3.p1  ORF type:complete len:3589 (-),score=1271.65 TRINITY_DN3328_c0_g1_i3:183-10949(-)
MTATGTDFDFDLSNIEVHVGGVKAEIVSAEQTKIIFWSPSQAEVSASAGTVGAGATVEYWTGLAASSAISDLTSHGAFPATPTATQYITDDLECPNVGGSNVGFRIRSLFRCPEDGAYIFSVTGQGVAQLSVSGDDSEGNLTVVATASATPSVHDWNANPSQSSAPITLSKGQNYLVELLAVSASGDDFCAAGAVGTGTAYTNSQVSTARQEKQNVAAQLGAVVKEVQSIQIHPGSLPAVTYTITIDDATTAGTFQVLVDGTPSTNLTFDADAATIEAAVNTLFPAASTADITATRTANTISIVNAQPTAGAVVTVSNALVPGGANTLTIAEAADAALTGTFTLTQGSKTSTAIPYGATAAEVQGTLRKALTVAPTEGVALQDFVFDDLEDSSQWNYGSSSIDDSTSNTGFKSMHINKLQEDQARLYLPGWWNTKDYPMICAAFRIPNYSAVSLLININGVGWRSIKVSHSHHSIAEVAQFEGVNTYIFNAMMWSYHCLDIDTALDSALGTATHWIKEVRFSNAGTNEDDTNEFWLDSFRISPYVPSEVHDVSVARSDYQGGYQYDVTIDACGVTGGTGGNAPLFTVDASGLAGNATTAVTRTTSASDPLGGSFTLDFQGQTTPAINIGTTAAGLKSTLEALSTTGSELAVSRWGSCFGYTYQVEFTTLTGDQPLMTADGSAVTGTGATVAVTEEVQGGLALRPLSSLYLHAVSNEPYVSVTVKGITSDAGSAAKLTYAASTVTTTISSVNPASGVGGDTITVAGSNFGTVPGNLEVRVGNAPCVMSTASANEITCVLVEYPAGEYPIRVWHASQGDGVASGSVSFTYNLEIDNGVQGINPAVGGLNGDTIVTINGKGFSTQASRMSVKFDGSPVAVVAADPMLVVRTSAHAAAAVDVEVTIDNAISANRSSAFTFDANATPTISNIAPATGSINGGTTVVIDGTGLVFNYPGAKTIVTIGGAPCTVTASSATQVTCTTGPHSPGLSSVKIDIVSIGSVVSSNAFDYSNAATPTVTGVTPSSGAIPAAGSTVTIAGSGFSTVDAENKVHLMNHGSHHNAMVMCAVTLSAADAIECTVPSVAAGMYMVSVNVVGKGKATSSSMITAQHTVTSVAPSSGSLAGGSRLVISGSGFSKMETVTIGTVPCVVDKAASTHHELKCTTGANSAGVYDLTVGDKVLTAAFTYDAALTPTLDAASPYSQQQLTAVVITGSGFGSAPPVEVTVAGTTCTVTAQSDTSITCTAEASVPTSGPLLVFVPGKGHPTGSNTFTYTATPGFALTGVDKTSGSTAGGSVLTIDGTGFGTVQGDVTVTIDGNTCATSSVSDTQIVCTTAATSKDASLNNDIIVHVNGKGNADPAGVKYSYKDLWSATTTWGGNPPPAAGETAVIPSGRAIYLDVSPPLLHTVIVQGKLIFEDNSDLALNAHYITVNGGELHIGSPTAPHSNKAEIILHGLPFDATIPTYGSKVLMVRNGVLHLHGQPKTPTWSQLTATVNAGDTHITLDDATNWVVGDEIVIASSSDDANEGEVRTITAVSGDGKTITFTPALSYTHWGEKQTYDGSEGTHEGAAFGPPITMDTRAEVAVLTRNVQVHGDPASRQHLHGSQIMVHDGHGHGISGHHGDMRSIVEVSYVEIFNAGQHGGLGRYPFHYHLCGRAHGSYLKGISWHHTFNRALTIHGTHGVLVQDSIAYDNFGHTFFLEDGIETENHFNHNLALLTRPHFSLLNTDVVPASFWITHPNNIYTNNVAAGNLGGFGFWYRLIDHPDGPSATTTVCPNRAKLGGFTGNRGHSNFRYGLRIFPEYKPMQNECNGGGTLPVTYSDFEAYMNHRNGGFAHIIGDIHFDNFKLADHRQAGFEINQVHMPDWKARMTNFLIVGRSKLNTKPNTFFSDLQPAKDPIRKGHQNEGSSGMWAPRSFKLIMSNIKFVNFNEFKLHCLTACSNCKKVYLQGGFETRMEKITFINAPNKVRFRWEHEGTFTDLDGTFTPEFPFAAAVPTSPFTVTPICDTEATFGDFNGGAAPGSFPGRRCRKDWKWRRVSLNHHSPKEVFGGQDITISSVINGVNVDMNVPQTDGRITHPKGYMWLLPQNRDYTLHYPSIDKDLEHYRYASYELIPSESYRFHTPYIQTPDHYHLNNGVDHAEVPSITPSSPHLAHAIDTVNKNLITQHSGQDPDFQKNVHVTKHLCPDNGCPPPPVPPSYLDPNITYYWSNATTWMNQTNPTGILPVANQDVYIHKDIRIIMDVDTPILGTVHVAGILEFADFMDTHFQARNIIIKNGELRIGTESTPHPTQARITLYGSNKDEGYRINNQLVVGSKAIGAFGILNLHGTAKNDTWTQLKTTARKGATKATLAGPVSWNTGDQVVFACSRFSPHEVDEVTITQKYTDVNGTHIEFSTPLKYDHLVEEATYGSKTWSQAAEVGRITRNIVIEGGAMNNEYYGAHVVVASYSDTTQTPAIPYTGRAFVEGVLFKNAGHMDFGRGAIVVRDLGLNPGGAYVRNCAFHTVYGTGVEVFASQDVTVSSNVAYYTVGNGFDINGNGNLRLINNMGIRLMHPETFMGRGENSIHHAIFWLRAWVHAEGNHAAGSEDIAFEGYPGSCSNNNQGVFKNNVGHSALMGFVIEERVSDCVRIENLRLYKIWDFGVFHFGSALVYLDGVHIADSNVGININSIGRELVSARDILYVGQSAWSDCNEATFPRLSPPSRTRGQPAAAFMSTTFPTKPGMNGPPKEWEKVKGDPNSLGAIRVSGVTFANFPAASSCPRKTVAFINNEMSHDSCPQFSFDSVEWIGVAPTSRYHFFPPDPDMINVGQCGNMECDGEKKCILRDNDGTLTGAAGGSVITSYQNWPVWAKGQDLLWWQKVQVGFSDLKQGVARDGCKLHTDGHYYECANRNNRHQQLNIKNLDADQKDRRIAPVGVTANGFTDMLNGPADWSKASGEFKNHQRSGFFFGIIPTHTEVRLDFTGTIGKSMDFTMPGNDANEPVILKIWYSNPNRLVVRVGGQEVPALDRLPNLNDTTHGASHFVHLKKTMYLLLRSTETVSVRTTPVISVSMRLDLTYDQFFEGDFVTNLALVLNIDANLIRVVNVRPGSVIVDFQVEDPSVSNPAVTFNDIKTKVTALGDGTLTIEGYTVMDVLYVYMPDDQGEIPEVIDTAAGGTGSSSLTHAYGYLSEDLKIGSNKMTVTTRTPFNVGDRVTLGVNSLSWGVPQTNYEQVTIKTVTNLNSTAQLLQSTTSSTTPSHVTLDQDHLYSYTIEESIIFGHYKGDVVVWSGFEDPAAGDGGDGPTVEVPTIPNVAPIAGGASGTDTDGEKKNPWIIVGASVGAVMVLSALVAFFAIRHRRAREAARSVIKPVVTTDESPRTMKQNRSTTGLLDASPSMSRSQNFSVRSLLDVNPAFEGSVDSLASNVMQRSKSDLGRSSTAGSDVMAGVQASPPSSVGDDELEAGSHVSEDYPEQFTPGPQRVQTYDADGNLVVKTYDVVTKSKHDGCAIAKDSEGNMVQVMLLNGPGTPRATQPPTLPPVPKDVLTPIANRPAPPALLSTKMSADNSSNVLPEIPHTALGPQDSASTVSTIRLDSTNTLPNVPGKSQDE